MKVALINSNRIQPPIAPIGLDYIAEALHAGGHEVDILDLCWEEDWKSAISRFFSDGEFDLTGMTLRNMDDCFFTSRESFLETFSEMVSHVRAYTGSPIVVGGVGYSTAPEEILKICNADVGIWGDGEFILNRMLNRMANKREWTDLPNLVWKKNGKIIRNPVHYYPLDELPPMSRQWVDNRRYYEEGGQLGIETKRGCPMHCIYCADPIAKGDQMRLRSPVEVADELEKLLELGCNHIHTCDSEFNIPEHHAIDICKELIQRDLGEQLRWYAYCSPNPFSQELAKWMRAAGCVGINFGTDSGDERMLKLLQRNYQPADILKSVQYCKDEGIAVMLDLLLGAPGESAESIKNTVEIMKRSEADRIGVALGVRVYGGTPLAKQLLENEMKKGLVGGTGICDPQFFLEPDIEAVAVRMIDQLIGDDDRFFFFHPERKGTDYNYNSNQKLTDAIRDGERGAYWDILRRIG